MTAAPGIGRRVGVICATGPGQHGDPDAGPGRARTPGPGCSRQPYSLAERKMGAAGQFACHRFPFPARSVTRWPNQSGERSPGHGGARHAQPRGQDGVGHCEMVSASGQGAGHRGEPSADGCSLNRRPSSTPPPDSKVRRSQSARLCHLTLMPRFARKFQHDVPVPPLDAVSARTSTSDP